MAISSQRFRSAIQPTRALKTGEVVADQLLARIARGDLRVGDHLPPEDELMDTFGVARTTLREGLRILEAQGFIQIRRGRQGGGRILAPRIDRLAWALAVHLQIQRGTMGDLDDARQLIEPLLAARLAKVRTDEDLEVLAEVIDEADRAAEAADPIAFALVAARVHETIVERAGNATLSTISRLLHELVQHYYLTAARRADQAYLRRAVRSYRRFHELVKAGDADAAEAHWRRQMTYTISRRDRGERLDVFTSRPGRRGNRVRPA